METVVANINPYLTEGPDVVLPRRNKPVCDVPLMGIGNKPIDGGYYLFTEAEKEAFLTQEPHAASLFRPWVGAQELINGNPRWCLFVQGATPTALRRMPQVMQRIEAVRKLRLQSKSKPTQKLAETPLRFHVENFPESDYLVTPRVSSERRFYLPLGYFAPEVIASDALLIIANASRYTFGVMCSLMHNAWMRVVCGRLESRYRYSASIVYNNFPWPEPTEAQRQQIEKTAQVILDIRAKYPQASLADLYDPLFMPQDLRKAHQANDRAVDAAYGKHTFTTEAQRVGFLFQRYQSLA